MTAQVHEAIIIDGKKTSMAFCPPLPEGDDRIIERALDEEMMRQAPSIIFSTACWRQYIGTWEIRNGKFYLVDIVGRYEKVGKQPILADWFTGVLRIPEGEMLHYVHMGFGSVFEKEIHIKIEKGVVTARRVIDNRLKKPEDFNLTMKNLPGGENRFDGDDEF